MYLLKKFKEHNKWSDLLNSKNLECYISIILTTIFISLIIYLDLYHQYQDFEEALKKISLYIASSLLGLVGIILAGIAIIIGVISKEVKKAIKHVNKKENPVERLLVSFGFIGFIIAIESVLFFFIYIILHSQKPLIPEIYFYIIVSIISYLFFFTIFYVVNLIGNCIRIYFISNKYEEIAKRDQNIYTIANEVRIDFLFHLLLTDNLDSEILKNRNLFLIELIDFVNNSNIPNKDNVINYFTNYY